MAGLRIDLEDLIIALTWHDDVDSSRHWLDRDSGELIFASDGVDEDDLPADLEDNPRYLAIDPLESSQGFRVMEDFVAGLEDARLAARLEHALQHRKPFRHFKDVLLDHPAAREDWFAFEHAANTELARRWCEAQGLEVEWVRRRPGGAPAQDSVP